MTYKMVPGKINNIKVDYVYGREEALKVIAAAELDYQNHFGHLHTQRKPKSKSPQVASLPPAAVMRWQGLHPTSFQLRRGHQSPGTATKRDRMCCRFASTVHAIVIPQRIVHSPNSR